MSNTNESTAIPEAVMQPFTELWSRFYEQSAEQTKTFMESFNGGADPKVWQKKWFGAVSESMDAYMRSPAFLQAIKHHLENVIQSKNNADDVSREVARGAGIPTAKDISGLFDRMHSVEEAILKRLEKIEKRLDGMSQSEEKTEASDTD